MRQSFANPTACPFRPEHLRLEHHVDSRGSSPSGVCPTMTRSSTGLKALAWKRTDIGTASSPSSVIGSPVRRLQRRTAPYRCSRTVPPPPVAYGAALWGLESRLVMEY